MSGFWQQGFWQTGFWNPGFWEGLSGTPVGKPKRRYGVQDGWKLHQFDTKADAAAFRASLIEPEAPAAAPARKITAPAVREAAPAATPRRALPDLSSQVNEAVAFSRTPWPGKVKPAPRKIEPEPPPPPPKFEAPAMEGTGRTAHIRHALRLLQEIRRLRRKRK